MKLIKIIFILTFLIVFSLQSALACICYTPPPPCYAYSQSDAVFVGTVKEFKRRNEDSYFIKITVAVDKNYKGINSDVVFTETGGSSCDFESYKENQKFLIYSNLYEKDKTFFATGLCSRSRVYSEDLIDLEFLNALDSSTPNYWIWGTFSKGYRGTPIQGIKAEVLDNKKKLTGISDKEGNLKIVVSKEGIYKVRVYVPTDKSIDISQWKEQQSLLKRGGKNKKGRFVEYEVDVKNNKCGWFDAVIIR